MLAKSILSIAALAFLDGCETPKKRFPASEVNGSTLAGVRVNPVQYRLAPDWEVKIHNGSGNEWRVGDLNTTKYKLGRPAKLQEFHNYVTQLKNDNEADARAHNRNRGFLPKNAAAAIDEIHELTSLLISRPLNEQDRNDAFMHIAELTQAFNFNFKYPIRGKTWIAAAPVRLLRELDNPVMGSEARPSINVITPSGADASLIDPPASSFWRNRGDARGLNMYFGHNRSELPKFDQPCKYDEAKDGYGVNGGFSIKCDGKKWKVKFGDESKVEPFNSRLVWALGYNSIPVDYARGIKVEYDRKLLMEYNSRQDLRVDIRSVFGFNYHRIQIQRPLDPFAALSAAPGTIGGAIEGAILRSGEFVPAQQLKVKLLTSQSLNAEAIETNYRTDYESQIQYFVLREANVEPGLDRNEKNLGSWSWNNLDHPLRRETRAFGIIAAFVNLYDTRVDNNRLRVATDSSGAKNLLHYIADLGSGLGDGRNLRRYEDGWPNLFPWEFIRRRQNRQEGQSEFDMIKYNTILDTEPFRKAQLADAKWIARKLARITEQQFTDALIASGWSAAETRIYLEKLVSRRDNLIKVLRLEGEFPLLRPNGANRTLNYNPQRDTAPVATGSGRNTAAPVNHLKIVNGEVVGH